MTDARLIEWNAVLDGIDMLRPADPETDVDYYLRHAFTAPYSRTARLASSVPEVSGGKRH
jgi:hypothetical protein